MLKTILFILVGLSVSINLFAFFAEKVVKRSIAKKARELEKN